ncbi:acyl-CoA ligase (AMP-forming), exosortase A system-associated [Sphingomonas colocasiae]|uniref:Acyl-CoA ligase (AMP-forming), exosortase A system-associated n=1 Tax=Sphingomonas colocasiae TaxID=1848973 RepID=A0ABS7PLD3_9SPHN|nr:acyl-CoA ligase (AMP-forming), exosortase A system-associated [Sphingomonas colocasiae]
MRYVPLEHDRKCGATVLQPDPVPQPLDHILAKGDAHAPALVLRSGTLDYLALDALVGRAAAGLRARGLVPGDRVAAWLAKTRLACIMPLAAARAGLIYVPLNPLLKRAQISHIMADCGARLLITNESRAASLQGGDVNCPVETDEDAIFADDALPPSSADPSDVVEILYTSGSTGRPKGVVLSHANLWLGAISVAHYLKLAPADRTLCVLPFSFDYGQNQLFSTWAAGGSAIPLDYLTPRDVIKAIGKHGVTTLAGVPPLWVQLAETSWPEGVPQLLRRLTNSGGAVPVPLVRKLQALFSNADLYLMYGLTEAFRSTYLDPALVDSHPGSMGKAIPFAEILVVRPDGSITDDGEPGELVHAGPLVAQGYWRDPERTAERYKPAPAESEMGGTAVFSGDRVVRDVNGLLSFVARADEMIKSAGNRISPTEVEEAAISSGAAMEAVALGVPDERLGQAILLIVRPFGDEAEERLRSWLKAELPGYMQPRDILLREELPRNPNGKLDRAAIRKEHGA